MIQEIINYHEKRLGIEGKVIYLSFSAWNLIPRALENSFCGYNYVGVNTYLTGTQLAMSIAHELKHVQQIDTGRLCYKNPSYFWHGKEIDLKGEYRKFPYEIEARKEHALGSKIGKMFGLNKFLTPNIDLWEEYESIFSHQGSYRKCEEWIWKQVKKPFEIDPTGRCN